MQYSKYQLAVFDFIKTGKGNAIVSAVAGSGKTTTMVESMQFIQDKKSIFLAFNKSIADELVKRKVNAKTFHGLCFGVVHKVQPFKLDTDKLKRILKNTLSYDQRKLYYSNIVKLIGLGKQAGVGLGVDFDTLKYIFFDHNMSLDSSEGSLEELFQLTEVCYKASINETSRLDFDDLLYFAVKYKCKFSAFDFVFVDEAQDLNYIQRQVLKQLMKSKTRLIAVGDESQSLYRFRGADSDSMELIQSEFNCTKLYLSISYRCPQEVVNYARSYNNEILAADNAPDGTVKMFSNSKNEHSLETTFSANDYIICRTTRPLISLAYKFISRNIPAMVMGRDIGKGLKTLVETCSNDAQDHRSVGIELEYYYETNFARLSKLDKEQQIQSLIDKCQSIRVLLDVCPTGRYNDCGTWLKEQIDMLFRDKKNAIVLSTVHKAKGLEAERVFWLNYNQCPLMWKGQNEKDLQQERNICYVAITRSKSFLGLITEDSLK